MNTIETLFSLAHGFLSLCYWAVILAAVVSTLISFGVLDPRNRMVWTIADLLARVTEPALRPIRNVLPNFGGLDLSPLLLIAIILLLQSLLGDIERQVIGSMLRGSY